MKNKLLIFTLLYLGLSTFFLSFLGRYFYPGDIFAHLRLHHLVYFFLLFFISFWLKSRILRITSLILTIGIAISIAPFYIPNSSTTDTSKAQIAFGSMNLNVKNKNYQGVLDYLEEKDFDFLFFQEFTTTWKEQLLQLDQKYPFNTSGKLDSNCIIGIKSKLPIESFKLHDSGFEKVPFIEVVLNIEGKKATVIGIHARYPLSNRAFKIRNNQFKMINELIRNTEGEIILAGDMNCTTWSPSFSILIENTNLRDTRKGFGIQSSWGGRIPTVFLPIDNIFVSQGIEVLHSQTGKEIGSDHLPKEMVFVLK